MSCGPYAISVAGVKVFKIKIEKQDLILDLQNMSAIFSHASWKDYSWHAFVITLSGRFMAFVTWLKHL